MKPRTLVNLGLLGLVLLLGGLAYFEPGVKKSAEPQPITPLKQSDIDRIRIDRKGKSSVLLERRQGVWWVKEPLEMPANGYKAESVARIAEATSQGSYPVDKTDTGKLGLKEPEIRLTLNDTVILVGNPEPLRQNRYVQVGNEVHLIGDTAYFHLVGEPEGFVNASLLPSGKRAVGFDLPGVKLRKSGDRWEATPRPTEFSADSVNKLVQAWQMAEAFEVKAYEKGRGQEVKVYLEGEAEPLSFVVITGEHEAIFARPQIGIEYHLSESSAKELLQLPQVEKPEVNGGDLREGASGR